MAEEKNLTIVPVVDNNVPMVPADISLIERVLQNLMDNRLEIQHQAILLYHYQIML